MRQIAFDLETTGLSVEEGHRVIEIGAVEIFNRQITGSEFYHLVNPQREVDPGAEKVHGYHWDNLKDEPPFAEVVQELMEFLGDSQLVIHNAPFDLGFLGNEVERLGASGEQDYRAQFQALKAGVTDSLELARSLHHRPNSLDALIARYRIDSPERGLHGALKDARLLAKVYLAMTGGQTSLRLQQDGEQVDLSGKQVQIQPLLASRPPTQRMVVAAEEMQAHEKRMQEIAEVMEKHAALQQPEAPLEQQDEEISELEEH